MLCTMCKYGHIPFSLSKSAESCELQCIECKAKDYREDMCSRITYQVVQCIHCHATMLLNDICSPHKQAQAKKPFTCPTHSGNNGCAQTPICILYHLSPPINALPVGKSYEKRTSFSGSPIFFCLLWLITLFMVMSGCATVPTKGCPGPDYVIQENGFCCGVVSCKRHFSVSMCQVNYGNDTCVRCPDESFLLDPTTSETATSCVKPVCMKNRTRPSLVKSTTVDQFACPQWCECDLSFNFCGTDPCNCRRGTCPYRTILQQDCGCSPVTPSPPKPTPSKEIPVTQGHFTTSKSRINVTTESSDSPSVLPVDTPTPGSVTPFPPGTTKASDSQTPLSIILIKALLTPVIFLIIIILVIYSNGRKKGKGTQVKTTEPGSCMPCEIEIEPRTYRYLGRTPKGTQVKTTEPGEASTLNSNSNQDEPDSPEHEATENGEVTQPLLNCSPVREQINVVETEAVIEDRPDHTRPDLSMDGPKSSLPGSSSNIQNNVEDEETEVKTVITTNDDAIELQTLSDTGKQGPLVENEDTSLVGTYAGEKEINPETKLKTVVSENHLPDSPRKQQNGVSSKESCNGHAKNST